MRAPSDLSLVLLLPLVGALLVALTGRRPNLREAVSILTAIGLFACVATLLPTVMAGEQPRVVLAEPLPGLPIALGAEPLGMLFAVIASFLWPVTTVYAIGYLRRHGEANQTRFYAFFALSMASAMGVAFADNLFTLFVFYEALTLTTYPLVTHAGTDKARRGGRVYLRVLMATSMGFLLLAIVWTWTIAGSLDFRAGGILAGKISGPVVGLLYGLYVFGIGKAAVMPFHRWLPAAMVAPTPSALLHAVAVVKAGVFSILKVTVYVFGTDLLATNTATAWLLYVAAATILLASLVAMTQDNLKARLAYSTVSQLAYVVLGAVLANAAGIIGGAMHIAMHAFGKITLFFCAGAILITAHKAEVSQMGGLGRRMPITMAAFLLASLSVAGLPPMGGVWSKWYLALGTLDAGHLGLLAVLMVSTLLNVAYLVPIPVKAFLGNAELEDSRGIREAPPACLMAILVTTAGCLFLFVYPEPFHRLASLLVQ